MFVIDSCAYDTKRILFFFLVSSRLKKLREGKIMSNEMNYYFFFFLIIKQNYVSAKVKFKGNFFFDCKFRNHVS